jgi:hypothetical protein
MAAPTILGAVGEKFLHFPKAHIWLPISDNWQLHAYLKSFPSYKAFYLSLPYMGKIQDGHPDHYGHCGWKFFAFSDDPHMTSH